MPKDLEDQPTSTQDASAENDVAAPEDAVNADAQLAEHATDSATESASDNTTDDNAVVVAADHNADASEETAETAQVAEVVGKAAEEAEQAESNEDPLAEITAAANPVSLLFHAPDISELQERARESASESKNRNDANENDTDDVDDDNRGSREKNDREDGGGRRRNRRGRGRSGDKSDKSDQKDKNDKNDKSDKQGAKDKDNKGKSGDDSKSDAKNSDEKKQSGEDHPSEGNGEEVSSRRRRRRRRGDSDLELSGGSEDDPPNTITRVRAPRSRGEASDKVASVRGSTRLEAKRQRRRESRETGRRRHGITEAEFLARRESVDRQMIVRQNEDRIQIGVMEDGVLAEHFVSKTQQDSLIGNVYLGKVQNVLPSMEAAFIDIGRGRNAVLYAGEVNWDAAGLENQPRRIELALRSGDSVLVQVTKDPVGHKGARLTGQISLPGRFLVYVPGGSMTGISRKLPDNERARLKKILKDRLPEGAGVIVRTAAEGASEEELTNDINRLRAQWEGIESTADAPKSLAPQLLYAEPDLTIKVVRDVFNEDFSKLIVSGEHAWDTIEAYVTYVAPDLLERLEKWDKDEDIFTAFRIDEQIAKALDRKVFLPSGGSLVIDRTEAMTVVDVNTGKFTGSGGNLEETVTKNNLEAAEEVVRQLRLRDIGGIIVIDFIDMVLESNRDLVLRRLVECLGRDRTKHQVAEVTSLGLVQMTRKRMGTGLLEVFGEQCEACAGRGVITHSEPVEYRKSSGSDHGHGRGHDHGDSQRSSRAEKKRRRNQQHQDQQESAPAAELDPEAAERAAKARAAMGNIAKALHPDDAAAADDKTVEAGSGEASGDASESNESGGRKSKRERRRRGRGRNKDRRDDAGSNNAGSNDAANDDVSQDAKSGSADAGESGLALNFDGETVAVPRGHQEPEEKAAPEVTLESLSAAFGSESDASAGKKSGVSSASSNGAASKSDSGSSSPEASSPTQPAPRRRRGRRAASSGGGADQKITVVEATEEPSAKSASFSSSAAAGSKRDTETAGEPTILGVGVSAEEISRTGAR